MVAGSSLSRLLAIVGPTATGKSALALKLAQKFDGEIISADSRTVYRYADIGTAKPSQSEMLQIPHHLIDVVDPDQTFTAAQFQQQAGQLIDEIADRGRLPIMVGGSGLYIDSVLYDYRFPAEANPELRAELEKLTNPHLIERLSLLDSEAAQAIDQQNRRRLIRAIETADQPASRADQLRSNTLVLGLSLNKNELQQRIEHRIKLMLSQGLIDEVKQISERYGWEAPVLSAPAYKAFRPLVEGQIDQNAAAAEFARLDWQLARRQQTWFKRHSEIVWLDAADPELLLDRAVQLVERFLSKTPA